MQLVRIRPEWRNNPEEDSLYEVLEDNGDRLLIREHRPRNHPMEIVPAAHHDPEQHPT